MLEADNIEEGRTMFHTNLKRGWKGVRLISMEVRLNLEKDDCDFYGKDRLEDNLLKFFFYFRAIENEMNRFRVPHSADVCCHIILPWLSFAHH